MGLNKPIIITTSAVDTSNLATKSDMTTLQNSVTSALANVGGMKIKSIQKGLANCQDNVAVTISSVNVSKSIAFISSGNGVIYGSDIYWLNGGYSYGAYLANATTLKVTHSREDKTYQTQWVVIELE